MLKKKALTETKPFFDKNQNWNHEILKYHFYEPRTKTKNILKFYSLPVAAKSHIGNILFISAFNLFISIILI